MAVPSEREPAEDKAPETKDIASNAPLSTATPEPKATPDPATASPGNRLGNAVVINEKLTDASPLDRKLPLNSANAPDKADVKCVAGNQVCPGEVDKLLADRTLAWISKSARAEDYVSGARLIAYSRVRNEMSCKQIARGLDEAQTALIALGAAISDESKLGRPTGNLTATRRIAVAVRDQLNGARKARC